jgi:transcription antitermination factor NusG
MLPSVIHVVGIGKKPLPIDSVEIASIRVIANSPFCSEPWPFINVGERVQVVSGPLTGAQGVILGVKNKYRLIASMTLLRRSIAVEIDRESVQPYEPAAGHRLDGALPGGIAFAAANRGRARV